MKKSSLKILMVFLAVLTVVVPMATVVLYSQWVLTTYISTVLVATELTEKPNKYFVLINPDPYTLEAIQNPGMHINVTFVEEDKITFLDQAEDHDIFDVEFEGKYYHIDVIVDLIVPFLQLLLLVELAGLVACWFVVIHKHLRKTTTNE